MGESAHKAKTDEGKKDGATRGRQDLKQMGRTEEENRGERRVNSARGRSTERILAAVNRRIGKDEGNLGHNNQGGNMEADVSTQNKDFNLEEFMVQVRNVGKGGEVKVPTNISFPTSSKTPPESRDSYRCPSIKYFANAFIFLWIDLGNSVEG